MIAHDPVHVAVEHALPEVLDVLARPDRRIDLGVGAGRSVAVEQQVADGDLAAEVDVRRSEEHTSELQSQFHLVCRLLLEKKKKKSLMRSCPHTHTCVTVSTRRHIPTL